MAGGESIVDSFQSHPSEKLVGVFEYMEPGFIWDERNVIFLSQDGDEVYLYHYIDDDEKDEKEVAELKAAYDFFKSRGIELTEWPVQVIPPPMGSRVLYPPQDFGALVYVSDYKPKPLTHWRKFLRLFWDDEPSLQTYRLNEELSITWAFKTVTIKRWQYHPVPLYKNVPQDMLPSTEYITMKCIFAFAVSAICLSFAALSSAVAVPPSSPVVEKASDDAFCAALTKMVEDDMSAAPKSDIDADEIEEMRGLS